ncbi:hypothetical protein D3C76_1619220 [compost metagenome]
MIDPTALLALEAELATVFAPAAGVADGFTIASATTGGVTVVTITADASYAGAATTTFGTITLTKENVEDDNGNVPAANLTFNL